MAITPGGPYNLDESITPGDEGVTEWGEDAAASINDLHLRVEGKAPVRATINAQTGTAYTPVLGDENKIVTLTNGSAITVTLPQDSALAFPVGGRIDFNVRGTGMATFSAGAGATVEATPSAVTRAQYSWVSAVKIAADTWSVVGDLETP